METTKRNFYIIFNNKFWINFEINLLSKEVYDNPEFIADEISRADMNQGAVGNCW